MRVTPQLVSRQAVESGLELDSKYLGVSIIEAVMYVQPLNPRPDPKDCYIAFDITMGINEEG